MSRPRRSAPAGHEGERAALGAALTRPVLKKEGVLRDFGVARHTAPTGLDRKGGSGQSSVGAERDHGGRVSVRRHRVT